MNYENRHGAAEAGSQKLLVFNLNDEQYVIDILTVQGDRQYDAVTRVANASACIKGVTDLRGLIVPIADMRLKFRWSVRRMTSRRSWSCATLRAAWSARVVDGVFDDMQPLTLAQIRLIPSSTRRLAPATSRASVPSMTGCAF